MEKKSLFERKSFLRQKLMSATALLLVASIMMVSSSYAWFVMSTAPEVSNIQTQVGSNGALEVALLDTVTWDDLDLLDLGDFDESVEAADMLDNNLTWGNIVNLSSTAYGLNQIVLNPARLNIMKSGEDESDEYQIGSVLLKTPIYGEDGRIKGLDNSAAVAYVYNGGTFSTEGRGVRAIGTASGMSVMQLGFNSARNQITTYMAAARREASNALNSSGNTLAGVVIKYGVSNQTTDYTLSDVRAARDLAAGMQGALTQLETAVRYAFTGYLATEDAVSDWSGYQESLSQEENYQAAVEAVLNGDKTLSQLMTEFSGIAQLIPNIGAYVNLLVSDQTKVDNAIASCDSMIAQNRTYTWDEISGVVYPLMDTDRMRVAGMTMAELKTKEQSELIQLVLNNNNSNSNSGGITVEVSTGSGLLSDIADFAGNYSAAVTVEGFTYGGYGPINVGATMKTATTVNPVYLSECSSGLHGAALADSSGSSQITDFYGYAIDLAFRTNAEVSDLLLQTEGVQRIYDDSTNAATQGGGSYMTFSTNSGLSVTKMIKMMQGIRVVFMDETQKVLAIAKLDCTLGKDAYQELTKDEKKETGKYAYLNAYRSVGDDEDDGASARYQLSDLIDYDDYSRLPDESSLDIDVGDTTYITARLYTRYYSMTVSDATHLTAEGEVDTETKYTGGLTVGNPDEQIITSLRQDVVKRITALVYLDGSFVTNAMVAADSTTSMTGVLNLQFSSSATLIPAENAALRSGSSEVTYTQAAEAGDSFNFNDTDYIVNEGYTIYTGSDDKVYYVQDGSDSYVELTPENFAAVLTVSEEP